MCARLRRLPHSGTKGGEGAGRPRPREMTGCRDRSTLAIAAAFLQALGYPLYARLFMKKVIRPNAASSFMFAYGTALLVLLEYSDGASWPLLALPATCAALSIGIALLCLRKGATDPVDQVEAMAFSADVWLTVLWAAIAFGYGDHLALSPPASSSPATSPRSPLSSRCSARPGGRRSVSSPRPGWYGRRPIRSFAVVTLLADQGRHPALLVYPLLSVALHGSVAVLALRGAPAWSAGSMPPSRSISAAARSMAKA